jgi:hypothetical protein
VVRKLTGARVLIIELGDMSGGLPDGQAGGDLDLFGLSGLRCRRAMKESKFLGPAEHVLPGIAGAR